MWPIIISLIVMFIFFLYIGGLFFSTFLWIVVNIPIIAFIFLKAKGDFKIQRGVYYYLALIIAVVIFIFTYGFFKSLEPIWPGTSFLLLWFAVAQCSIYLKWD